MALMGSDQAKMGQNDQARAVLEWLSSEGAQNLLRQVSADRAQTADEPDIQRGQEEVQRRRDTAVHDWLNTPEAQRFLMGRGDADIAMRQQGQRGPGSGVGSGMGGPSRGRMLEGLMAAGRGNPDWDRGGGGSTSIGGPGGPAWQESVGDAQFGQGGQYGAGSTFERAPYQERGEPGGAVPRWGSPPLGLGSISTMDAGGQWRVPRPEFQGANWGRPPQGPGYGPPR